MVHSHYENLQVSRTASDEVIKGAYRYLSQKWHPDKQPSEKRSEAERIMKLVNDAYAVLSDPARRREHDEWIVAEEAREQAAAATGGSTSGPGSGSPNPTEPEAGLSAQARTEYAKAIAAGHWPLALLTSFIGVSLIVGLLQKIEWVRTLLDNHPVASILVILFLIGGGAKAAVDERRDKVLDKNDDQTLKVLYEKSSRRNATAAICATILVAAGALAYAVWLTRPELIHQFAGSNTGPLDKPAPDATRSNADAAALAAASAAAAGTDTASTVDVSAGATADRNIRVENQCGSPIALFLAMPDKTSGQWSIKHWKFDANEAARLNAKIPPSDTYYFARSTDNVYTWAAGDGDKTSRAFSIDADAPAVRFVKIEPQDGPEFLLKLRCAD